MDVWFGFEMVEKGVCVSGILFISFFMLFDMFVFVCENGFCDVWYILVDMLMECYFVGCIDGLCLFCNVEELLVVMV